ncbi:Gfo/Idh/MocA family oxidoreductase [bacterium]|nr:Gfo/Idh/MocA family oxidoreductase [bacterium]
MSNNTKRIGVVGCGGFGLFALQHFMQIPGVTLAAMACTHRPAAIAAGKRFGIEDVMEVENLVQQPDIDLVYIATPPFLHHEQAMMALRAGKHVICEKPLAMSLDQADEMIAEARMRGLILVANLMQRYNPLFGRIKQLVETKILGEFLYGHFENCASDESLLPEHWFWDREKSGGLFIEHGVHFFDLFSGWFGPGKVESAQRSRRPDGGMEEQVNCAVRYGSGALVNFYHGFHQPGRLDRQETRLVFERGDVRLYEWIPTKLSIHCVVDEERTRELCDLFPGSRLDVTVNYGAKDRPCRGRHKDIDAMQLIEFHHGDEKDKMHLYGELLRAMFRDQAAWIPDHSHQRVITEENGRRSLAMAIEAMHLADGNEK